MRNPNRIQEILDLIRVVWAKDPDLRFNQLIYNLQNSYSHQNNAVGRVVETESDGFERIGFDLFNLEDDEFIKFLRQQTE